MSEKYLDIYWNGKTFDVNVRWCRDDEQHQYWEVDTVEEVNEITSKFFNEYIANGH